MAGFLSWKRQTEVNKTLYPPAPDVPDWDPELERRKEMLGAISEALGGPAVANIPNFVPDEWLE